VHTCRKLRAAPPRRNTGSSGPLAPAASGRLASTRAGASHRPARTIAAAYSPRCSLSSTASSHGPPCACSSWTNRASKPSFRTAHQVRAIASAFGRKTEVFRETFTFGPALGSQTVSAALPQLMKVFWFFFSKKNYIPSFFLRAHLATEPRNRVSRCRCPRRGKMLCGSLLHLCSEIGVGVAILRPGKNKDCATFGRRADNPDFSSKSLDGLLHDR
jgi:hypothetical protein